MASGDMSTRLAKIISHKSRSASGDEKIYNTGEEEDEKLGESKGRKPSTSKEWPLSTSEGREPHSYEKHCLTMETAKHRKQGSSKTTKVSTSERLLGDLRKPSSFSDLICAPSPQIRRMKTPSTSSQTPTSLNKKGSPSSGSETPTSRPAVTAYASPNMEQDMGDIRSPRGMSEYRNIGIPLSHLTEASAPTVRPRHLCNILSPPMSSDAFPTSSSDVCTTSSANQSSRVKLLISDAPAEVRYPRLNYFKLQPQTSLLPCVAARGSSAFGMIEEGENERLGVTVENGSPPRFSFSSSPCKEERFAESRVNYIDIRCMQRSSYIQPSDDVPAQPADDLEFMNAAPTANERPQHSPSSLTSTSANINYVTIDIPKTQVLQILAQEHQMQNQQRNMQLSAFSANNPLQCTSMRTDSFHSTSGGAGSGAMRQTSAPSSWRKTLAQSFQNIRRRTVTSSSSERR